jgi:hypothetical protein
VDLGATGRWIRVGGWAAILRFSIRRCRCRSLRAKRKLIIGTTMKSINRMIGATPKFLIAVL